LTDTLRTVDEAIQAHIAEKFEGALVDSWIIVAHAQTIEGGNVSNYRIVTHETQPLHVDAGLLDIGRQIVRDTWDAAYEDDDDD
jgi:hypothetical protein